MTNRGLGFVCGVILIALSSVVHGAQADYTYTTNYGFVNITGYTGPGGAVTIPSEIDGFPVVWVGYGAFKNCTNLSSVAIPDSATRIETSAFENCTALTNVLIGNNVSYIGSSVFSFCSNLATITIPESVTRIEVNAFRSCTSLTNITIPGSVTNLSSAVFSRCTSLTSVVIGSGVRSIGDFMFRGCSSLTQVIIGNGVTNIGERAFYECFSLAEFTIPTNVASIGSEAFENCTNLTAIAIPDSVTSIGDEAFYGCFSLTNVTIGGGLVSMGRSAFYDCSGLIHITVENGAKTLGNSAFRYCSSLRSLTIPDSVVGGVGGFSFCASLTNLVLGSNVTSIGCEAFYHCSSLTSVIIPNAVTNIDYRGFCYCSSLAEISLGSNVATISSQAFVGCSNLTSVTFPASVTNIGYSIFHFCPALSAIYFQGDAPNMDGSYISSHTNLVIYYLPGTSGWGTSFGGRSTMLLEPPVIVEQPRDQSVFRGDTVRFVIAATPSSAPFYQWSKNGVRLQDGGNITGASTANLQLANAQPAEAGSYLVVLSNLLGSLTSSVATLTVVSAPNLGEAADVPHWTWNTGGDALWSATGNTTHDGVDAVQSGAVTHDQQSWLETTVNGPGTLSFWWKVSSQSNDDYLEFYIGNSLQSGRISGTVNWQERVCFVPGGPQIVRWRYAKNSSLSAGEDRGWVDQVCFTTSPTIHIQQTTPYGFVVTFDGVLQYSTNLRTWVEYSPQPVSPWTVQTNLASVFWRSRRSCESSQ